MAEKEIRRPEGMKNIRNETQKHKRLKKYESRINGLCNDLKQPYVYVIAVPEEEKEG